MNKENSSLLGNAKRVFDNATVESLGHKRVKVNSAAIFDNKDLVVVSGSDITPEIQNLLLDVDVEVIYSQDSAVRVSVTDIVTNGSENSRRINDLATEIKALKESNSDLRRDLDLLTREHELTKRELEVTKKELATVKSQMEGYGQGHKAAMATVMDEPAYIEVFFSIKM